MDAGMLKCPACGAEVAKDATSCTYCRAHLRTAACAGCFGMNFAGSKHCVHCGSKFFEKKAEPESVGPRKCPRCEHGLSVSAVGEAFIEDCAGCGGMWVDTESFKKICERREKSAAFVGMGSPLPLPGGAVKAGGAIQYLRCPDCDKLMNRLNFARHSGVIVDVCKTHGTWFDHDELRQILEFIQAGGLDAAREKELNRLEQENQRLQSQRRAGGAYLPEVEGERPVGDIIDAAGGLLRFLIG
jgi:Zn-finger nucleic acid-binding protein